VKREHDLHGQQHADDLTRPQSRAGHFRSPASASGSPAIAAWSGRRSSGACRDRLRGP
jgi:hypothetical protein